MLADLIRAPLFAQPLLSELPGRVIDPSGIERSPFTGKPMRLPGAVASLSTVAAQLSADGRGMAFKQIGNLALRMPCLDQGVNLVSFFLGEVCVVHFCNFDWPVKKAWMLPHPAYPTGITQNCTSSLNPPSGFAQSFRKAQLRQSCCK